MWLDTHLRILLYKKVTTFSKRLQQFSPSQQWNGGMGEAALKLGADYVATGHYARKASIETDDKIVYDLVNIDFAC